MAKLSRRFNREMEQGVVTLILNLLNFIPLLNDALGILDKIPNSITFTLIVIGLYVRFIINKMSSNKQKQVDEDSFKIVEEQVSYTITKRYRVTKDSISK